MRQKILFLPVGIGLALTVFVFYKTEFYNIKNIFWFLFVLFCVSLIFYSRKHFKIQAEKQLIDICQIFQNSPDLIYYKNKKGKYITCNLSFAKAHGFDTVDDVIGKEENELYDKAILDELKRIDDKIIKTGVPVRFLKMSKVNSENLFVHEVVKIPVKVQGKISGIAAIGRDVTEQYKLQEYLIYKQAQLSSFLNNTSLYIFMLDLDGKILLGNEKFNELIGLDDGACLGKTIKDTVLSGYYDVLLKDFNEVVSEKSVRTNDIFIELNEEKSWLKVVKAPVFDKNQKVIGVSCVMNNINEEVKLNELKAMFWASLSHDLKTPLTAQIRALDLVLKNSFGKLSDAQRDIIEQIWGSNKQLYRMVTNLLNTYKNEDGLVRLQFSKIHLKRLTEDVIQELTLFIRERNLKIEFSENPESDVISADEQEIRRVILNLLSNAVFYADNGTNVRIAMHNDGNEFVYEVTNNSNYIEKESLAQLFDKYVSVCKNVKRTGTGLGLYASRQIIHAHNGFMLAKSYIEGYNMFGFVVPVNQEKQVNTDRPEIIKNL